MQQVLVKNGSSIAARGGLQVPSQRNTAAFKPAVKGNKVFAGRKLSATVRATAAPAIAQASPFAAVNSEAALFAILKAGAAGGKIPGNLMAAVEDLYVNYKGAVIGSGLPGATEELVAKVMASVCERVLIELTPGAGYTFPSYHTRILEPYNYYNFGQRYIRGLVDFQKSQLGNVERFKEIERQLANGDNVVLLANHQTEADPAAFALLLEAEFPSLATDVIYVAGDRVVTDPLCKPFSMGRNLFCVHSKKHLDDIPELKAEKQATNRRTLKAMQGALNEGGKLLWIAPSGGRDRATDPATGNNVPDKFDPTAVELMRALITKAKPAGHLYPFAMYTYKVMPPPKSIEKSIGERRLLGHAPVGLAVCEELDTEKLVAGIEDKEAKQIAVADAAWSAVFNEYDTLLKACEGVAAPPQGYGQPWLNYPLPELDQWL
ncbi:hypothetical protein Ndes2437B_g01130 [Nannochloris sp. 'desiccata']